MITYNHQNYIEQAINGVLMQKTNFNFELIIANDNSPDETDAIIKKCIDTHINGNKIKYINNTSNIGMMPNFINAIKNCTGKYIALCEGDDYWTDEKKLQKQVDFLERNNDFSICFHHVNIDNNGIIIEDNITKKVPSKTTIKDLAEGNYIHTCSVVYRNNLFEKFPDYFYKAPVGDYFLHLLNSRYGKIFCFDEIMAIYRVHETSYWSSKQQEERNKIWIDFLNNIKPNFSRKIRKILKKQIINTQPKKISISKKLKKILKKFINTIRKE